MMVRHEEVKNLTDSKSDRILSGWCAALKVLYTFCHLLLPHTFLLFHEFQVQFQTVNALVEELSWIVKEVAPIIEKKLLISM
jgi:hypothetical protein